MVQSPIILKVDACATITDYLTNRMQYIVVKGISTKPLRVISGVPQGSVLGPLLFLMQYIVVKGNAHKRQSQTFKFDGKNHNTAFSVT